LRLKTYVFTNAEQIALRNAMETERLRLRDLRRTNPLDADAAPKREQYERTVAALLEQFSDDIRLSK
jgi:hypothetical protein